MNMLKSLREQAGYTQKKLAATTGLSLRTIQRFESCNKVPKGNTLLVLSYAFEISPKELQSKIKAKSKSKTKTSNKFLIKLIGILKTS